MDERLIDIANPRLIALSQAQARRREMIRSGIEEVALGLFQVHGVAAVTVDQIADAAAISRRTFYRYFGSPDDVLRGALGGVMDSWTEAVRARPVDEPLVESARFAIDSFAASFEPTSGPRRIFRILESSPDVWLRIAGRLQAHVAGALGDVIADRLRHRGGDATFAGGIAVALAALIMHSVGRAVQEGRGLLPGEIEGGLEAIGVLVGNQGPMPIR